MKNVEYEMFLVHQKYGLKAINLVIERHNLAELNRSLYQYQHNLYKLSDPKYQAEIDKTFEEMNKNKVKLSEIDQKIQKYGINKSERVRILKLAKEYAIDSWYEGFEKI